MEDDWLSELAVPAEAAKPLPNGGVYIPATPSASDIADQARKDTDTAIKRGANVWTTLSAEEAAAQGLPPGVTYQRNELGKVQPVGGQKAATPATPDPTRIPQIETALSNLQNLRNMAGDVLAVGKMSGNVAEWPVIGSTLGQNRANVEGALQMVEGDLIQQQIAKLAEANQGGVSGMANSLPEARRMAASIANLDPDQDEENFLIGIKRAEDFYVREYMRLNNGQVPKGYANPDAEPVATATAEVGAANPETPTAIPGAGFGAAPVISGEAGAFLTPQNIAFQDELRAAFAAGANLPELQAIAQRFGQTVPATQEQLDEARRLGGSISVTPTGMRDASMRLRGSAAETAPGAFAVGAANALTAGTLDELGSALGADAATIQAGKEYLRDKYPVSSIAGEVAGQAMGLAAGGAAARSAGLGARSLAGMELAQGAAYGAGESNDNRLAGAALGAGGALVGQQIAKRLIEPAAQSIIQRISRETGAPVEEVTRVAQEAFEAADAPIAPEITPSAMAPEMQGEVAALARQAIGRGRSARKAKEELAKAARVDPEAAAAVERLGMELPIDIVSDGAQVKSLTGLARSQVGSEAATNWIATSAAASDTAERALATLGATRDIANVSDDVFRNMDSAMTGLQEQAKALRAEVDEAINVRDRVDADNLQGALSTIIADFGGLEEAKGAFSAEERRLLAMLGEGEVANRPTYARLNQMRDQIGDALYKGKGPWADTSQANLARYYAALADDQMAYIERTGGQAFADKQRAANSLFSQMYKARKEMQAVFGQDLNQSIVPLVRSAVVQGKKGDIAKLNKLLAAAPAEMQGQILLSGLLDQSLSKTGAAGNFSFANYAATYRGLRQNSPIYAKLAKAVGPEGDRILRDLYTISRRMAEGETYVLKTGKANQGMIAALQAESLVGNVMRGVGKRAAGTAAAATVGSMVGGPAGGVVGASVSEAVQSSLSGAAKSQLDRVHSVLASDEFKGLIDKAARGEPVEQAVARLSASSPFAKYARAMGISDAAGRRRWIESAMAVSATGAAPQDQTVEVVIQ